MYKRILIILMGIMFIFGISKISFAMMCGEHGKHQQIAQAETEHKHESTEATAPVTPTEAVNVGNKICPVSNEKIKEGEKYQVEHEGKIYNLCCKMCLKDFKKDPQKYIKKVEEELEARSKEETEATKMVPEAASSQGMHEGHHQGTHEEHPR